MPEELQLGSSLIDDIDVQAVVVTKFLVRLEDPFDQFQGYGVLQPTTEMYQEEDALLDHSDVRLLEDSCITQSITSFEVRIQFIPHPLFLSK